MDQGKKYTLKRRLVKLALCLLPGLAGIVLHVLSGKNKAFCEWFTCHVQKFWVNTVGRFVAAFPFSVSEAVVLLALPLSLYLIVRDLVRLIRGRHKRSFWLLNWLAAAVLVAGCFWLSACIGNGVSYGRETFAEKAGMIVAGGTKEELYAVCRIMVEGINEYADRVKRDETGESLISKELPAESVSAMKKLGKTYDFLDQYYPRPKPVLFSEFLSKCNITGIFTPFIAEANYNKHIPAYNIGHTVCHELAHTAGFAREDEANFIGFLACIGADSDELAYSGYMLGYIYVGNALYGEDYDGWDELRKMICDEASLDLRRNTEYWSRYEKTKAAEVSDKLNDTNLKVHHQTDGIKSYGRVVDLMLAYYRR